MLLARHLRVDPADPLWADRDRVFHTAGVVPPPGAGAVCIEGPHGLTMAAAVGAALAERMLAARFGRSLVDHRTWVLAGPAELAAGTTLEAAGVAGAGPLGRLAIVATLPEGGAPALARFTAFGWVVRGVATADAQGFDAAVAAAQRAQKPTLIACLGPQPAPEAAAATRGASARRAWLKRLRRHGSAEAFARAMAGKPGPGWLEALAAPANQPPTSPAEAVAAAMIRLAPAWAELTGARPDAATQGPFAGRSVAWGDCAQAAAGGLLGMALHGGIVPVGQIARLATDAALPALRAAAALQERTLHLVQEDGPCPAGLLAAWRALPGARLFRPADAVEALECLELALRHGGAPSILLLSAKAAIPLSPARPHACARGGYLTEPAPARDVTLIAGGADLALALAARALLAAGQVNAALVSLPCWHLFAAQTADYRREVLGQAPRVGLEAGGPFGWARLLGEDGLFIDTGATPDPAAIATAILRSLRHGRQVLESEDNFD